MALTGAWKDARAGHGGARKWGTGINPVHSTRTADGRHVAPEGYDGVDDYLTTQWQDDGFDNSDVQVENHELPRDIGLYDRPNYGDNPQHIRGGLADDDFPAWGTYRGGVPGGTDVRSRKHGSDDAQTPNQIPTETVSEGWLNKPTGDVEDAITADTAQLFMQTSMTQRDKVREGSQRGAGSQNDPRAPIGSRIVGQKLKVYSGGVRHEDMRPKTQTQGIFRGWWNRTAGTGRTQNMLVNTQRERIARSRQVPADPYVPPPAVVDAPNYGYQEEDMIPYA